VVRVAHAGKVPFPISWLQRPINLQRDGEVRVRGGTHVNEGFIRLSGRESVALVLKESVELDPVHISVHYAMPPLHFNLFLVIVPIPPVAPLFPLPERTKRAVLAMLPSLTATELTPCWRKKSFISCRTFGFVVTPVATQRLMMASAPSWRITPAAIFVVVL